MPPSDIVEFEYAIKPDDALIKHTDTAIYYYAIIYNIIDAVRMLIRDHWLDINAKDIEERTLLHYTAQYGREDITRVVACEYWAYCHLKSTQGDQETIFVSHRGFI